MRLSGRGRHLSRLTPLLWMRIPVRDSSRAVLLALMFESCMSTLFNGHRLRLVTCSYVTQTIACRSFRLPRDPEIFAPLSTAALALGTCSYPRTRTHFNVTTRRDYIRTILDNGLFARTCPFWQASSTEITCIVKSCF